MIKKLDAFLDSITMYRLVVYGLTILLALGFVYSATGRLSFTPQQLALSALVVMGVRFVTDQILALIWKVPLNLESGLITGLILVLILRPATSAADLLPLALAGIVASAGKFLLTVRGKHVYNPAALAAASLSVSGLYTVSWWVGSSAIWPFSLLIGLAIVRKIRRFPLVLTFAAVSIGLELYMILIEQRPLVSTMQPFLISSPLIFLATIMLTEPSTMPPRRSQQIIFAAGVAVLYVTAFTVGPFHVYPQVALLLGNIYAFAVSPRYRLRLKLTEIRKVSDRVYSYIFQADKPFDFTPGQYMEWTLPGVPYDSRGNRRTFTIASSPTEKTIQLGLKYYEPASQFKITVNKMKPGDIMLGGQIAGDFTLAGREKQKLVFIAGGIGITPFRSMAKYLTDTKTKCDIVLLYIVADPAELAYEAEFKAAKSIGLRYVPILSKGTAKKGMVSGMFSQQLIADQVSDYAERYFYISGPHAMVEAGREYLQALSVPRRRIKSDHFSGY